MNELNKFPRKLLKESTQARVKYFVDLTVAHPRLLDSYKALLRAVHQPFFGKLIFVYGPTGVGKTTLWRKVQKQLLEEHMPQFEDDRGKIPFVGIDLASPDYGAFNWKDFYRRFLLAMDEPLIEHKSNPEKPQLGNDGRLYLKVGLRSGAADLRLVIEQALRYRRPAAILIDEAQHLTKIASGRKLQDQLDCLKSLSNQTGSLIVLFGTYELLIFLNLSAQLSRRSIDIHFQRYSVNSEDDISAFQSILMTFQQHLPFEEEPNLIARWDYFYERSIGCVGVLKEWLTLALNEALENGEKRLTRKHIARYALSIAKCQKMLSDARESESKMAETEEAYRRLRLGLGLEVERAQGNSPKEMTDVSQKVSESLIPKKRLRKPGRRNPKRDKSGQDK